MVWLAIVIACMVAIAIVIACMAAIAIVIACMVAIAMVIACMLDIAMMVAYIVPVCPLTVLHAIASQRFKRSGLPPPSPRPQTPPVAMVILVPQGKVSSWSSLEDEEIFVPIQVGGGMECVHVPLGTAVFGGYAGMQWRIIAGHTEWELYDEEKEKKEKKEKMMKAMKVMKAMKNMKGRNGKKAMKKTKRLKAMKRMKAMKR